MTLSRWERLEEYLYDKDDSSFSVYEYMDDTGLDAYDARMDIQSYLRAQRGSRSKTLYVLRRLPGTRTTNARWSAGVRTKDARHIGKALADDTKRRVMRAFQPDLIRLGMLNKRAKRQVEAQISAVIDGAMAILAAAAEGMQRDDDE